MAAPLTTRQIALELADYRVELPEPALAQLSAYLELLLHWNRRVNLIGLREPRTIVRRLFGESLYLARLVELRGWLVDVGSGAGFPGLALKLVAPDLRVTLVESRQRKGVFLKEVARECLFYGIDVVRERFETWAEREKAQRKADFITTRAVRQQRGLLRATEELLAPGGRAVFFTTWASAPQLTALGPSLSWGLGVAIPNTSNGVILIGRR